MVCQTANETIANSRRQEHNVPNTCLMVVRGWLEIDAQQPDANDAWRAAKHKHPGDRNPPRGAPVFWDTSEFGHIALAITKDLFRSTDTKSSGNVATVNDRWHDINWNKRYLGWTEDLNGVDIPYLRQGDPFRDFRSRGDVYVDKLRVGQTDSDSVRRLRYRLEHHPDIPQDFKPGTGGAYGDVVVKAVKWWQRNVAGIDGAKGEDISNAQARRLFGDNYKVIHERES